MDFTVADTCGSSLMGARVVIRASVLLMRWLSRVSSMMVPSVSPLLTGVAKKVSSSGAGVQWRWSRRVKASWGVMGQVCSAQVLTVVTIFSGVYA